MERAFSFYSGPDQPGLYASPNAFHTFVALWKISGKASNCFNTSIA
jgi:hypothetical protein